jgi:hypothetical protein
MIDVSSNYRFLAIAIITQAVKDFNNGNKAAYLWIMNSPLVEMCDLNYDVRKLVSEKMRHPARDGGVSSKEKK